MSLGRGNRRKELPPRGQATEAADCAPDLVSMTKTMMDHVDKLTSRVEALEMKEQHPVGNAGVEEGKSGERSESAAEVGETAITPPEQQPPNAVAPMAAAPSSTAATARPASPSFPPPGSFPWGRDQVHQPRQTSGGRDLGPSGEPIVIP